MPTLGRALILLALAVALYGIVAALVGARTGRRDLVDSARRAVYALAALTTGAFVLLELAFLRDDFGWEIVASHSSSTTPLFYKFTAVWSSQEGSLLLWVWLLSLWSSLALFLTRRRLRDVVPYATAVLLGFGAFFAALLAFLESPFTVLAAAPSDGVGLNPLLRHPSMMIHPPMLYSGYTLFAVPFAFAVGALARRRVDADWIAATRRFALAAWLLLGTGILLGARWSYAELGWGGYWAWDPVENASLLPWLTGTAFLHSIMLQEKRGMLKVWNASLILATGTLCVLGTFLVRSGILDSIHAFGASTLGVPFVTLIAVIIAGSIALVVSRRDALRSEHRLDSMLSREAVFVANNVVLVGLAFVVFWGTFFPLIAEALTGERKSVGPPWFDRYTVPLALVLTLLSGVGPVIAWRRATWRNARRAFALPVAAGAATAVACAGFGLTEHAGAAIMFALAAFVAATVGQELWRGVGARRAMSGEAVPSALVSLVRRNRRRYGGYTVHLGIAVLFVGIAASSAFQDEREVRLSPGQSASVGAYDVRYVRSTGEISLGDAWIEKIDFGAVLEVRRDGRLVETLRPERGFYPSRDQRLGPLGQFFEGEATSEVGLKAGFWRDVWTAVQPDTQALQPIVERADAGFAKATEGLTAEQRAGVLGLTLNQFVARYREDPPPATFRLIVSPMVAWMWIGALIAISGGLIALWPAPDAARRRATARAAARVAQDLGRA
ncbi:MAG TPA: cytochrome c-type biogenesis CcmF C-terminal domain-containing protein [Solirubrobacteraceae bacterium]|jgi:cytochrome c-type biogenesis protein CcmF|nr:cytochrome c-type biogenesis CcmF C-terminal domain-containing protein [Solirubrobacteraceae bacterium]